MVSWLGRINDFLMSLKISSPLKMSLQIWSSAFLNWMFRIASFWPITKTLRLSTEAIRKKWNNSKRSLMIFKLSQRGKISVRNLCHLRRRRRSLKGLKMTWKSVKLRCPTKKSWMKRKRVTMRNGKQVWPKGKRSSKVRLQITIFWVKSKTREGKNWIKRMPSFVKCSKITI